MKKYFKHKIKSLLLVNKIVVIHYLELNGKFFHEEEKHDFWEIVCAVKGKVTCTADGKEVNLNDGDIYFHKPNELHSLTVDGNENAGVFVLSFECLSESMRFFSDRKVKLNNRQLKYIKEIIEIAKRTYDITFYDLATDIMNLLPQPTLGGEQLIKNYVETLLIDVMRSMTETQDGNDVFLQETEINNKLAEDIIKILKENIFGRVSIDDISRKINYSKAYVFKQFKWATNKSVMAFYSELKIKKAKEMIRKESLTIKEIAEKLCFDTPNYFSKTFKKITGIAPTEYKKRVAE
ncbi:MAG: helix-turn-helix transcriptional regulator [Clostridia bacterium]|nr:helix-turn-helix transcriptional regulator [Clostridia bacterium]